MSDLPVIVLIVLVAAVLVMQVMLLRRRTPVDPASLEPAFDEVAAGQERIGKAVREEIAGNRAEAGDSAKHLREEVTLSIKGFTDSVLARIHEMTLLQQRQLETFSHALQAMSDKIEHRLTLLTEESGKRLDLARSEATGQAKQTREETAQALRVFNESVTKSLAEMRATVETKLTELQTQNAAKLDEMRHTVDEKLQGALEKRLGESFKLVSDRLEQVHRGLGEMQTLATGVGDLKRVLSNVKTRGNWGEMQLGNLLEQMLSPDQYAANVCTKPGSGDRVEFAIKLPGRDELQGDVVWLPIDAKFPREDYERLVEASEKANIAGVEEAGRQLELRIRAQAKTIRDKYLEPPHTTDFAILFLPIEGLYAEVLRRPGLVESLQHDCRVNIAGPTTLAALLNSLQMGFRTLAISQRSSEVWKVLGAIKTEFSKFGQVIAKVKSKLQEASNTIEKVDIRTRAISRKLRDVQELPAKGADNLFLLPGSETDAEPGESRIPD